MQNISFYCINFNDEDRRTKMINRFKSLNLDLNFIKSVDVNDERIISTNNKSIHAMLQHLDTMNDFIKNTTNEYLIICEDDIYISKSINNDLPNIINTYEKLKLDILLLGYLIPFKLNPNNSNTNFPLIYYDNKHGYYKYPDDLWGSQMYLINRNYAIKLIEILDAKTYEFPPTNNEINSDKKYIPYAQDGTITKIGNRALIYPMLGVEEGDNKSDHKGQKFFHKICNIINYCDKSYI